MKKILIIFLMVIGLCGNEYNLLISKPIISDESMEIVNRAINKGFENQYKKIQRLLIRNDISSVIEFPYYIAFQYQDNTFKEVNDIITNLMEDIYNIEKDEIDSSTKQEDESMSLDGSLDVSKLNMSEFKDISKKSSQKGNLEELGEDAIIKIGNVFMEENEDDEIEWVGEAKFHPYGSDDLVPLNGIYGMIFIPTVRGRTHTMAIRMYLIDVNDDGKSVTVMRKIVKEFPWYRNPRYISAVTGTLLKEILSLGTKQKIE